MDRVDTIVIIIFSTACLILFLVGSVLGVEKEKFNVISEAPCQFIADRYGVEELPEHCIIIKGEVESER